VSNFLEVPVISALRPLKIFKYGTWTEGCVLLNSRVMQATTKHGTNGSPGLVMEPIYSQRALSMILPSAVGTPPHRNRQDGHHYDILQIVLNLADTLLASASDDHTVRLWQVPTGTEVARYNHSHVILRVTFSVNGPFLYSGGEDKRTSQRQIPVEVLAAARRAQKTEVTMSN
jgi:hypothetical protein